MDIPDEFEKAKTELLKKGRFMPLLCVELQHAGVQRTPVSFLHMLESQVYFYALGCGFRQYYRDDRVRAICFIAEMCGSALLRPSGDPQGKEALMAQSMHIDRSPQFEVLAVEIVRHGEQITLLSMSDIEVAFNYLLPCFMQGFQDGARV